MSHMVVSQVSEFVRHTHWLGLRADPRTRRCMSGADDASFAFLVP